MPLKGMTINHLMDRFHTNEACRALLEELRWPDGPVCPRCEGTRHTHDTVRGVYDCYGCGYQFSVMAGTIFHDSKLPLRTWFIAVLLMIEAKKGVSAMQLKRTLDIKTYKTAWYLCHRVRAAMRDAYPMPLKGIIEVDETYLGGKVRGKGKGYVGNKAIVVGAVQRHGKIILQVADGKDRATLHGFVNATVDPDAEAIHTDENPAYIGVGDENTRHETVNHKAEEYVRYMPHGIVHTNSVENVWSLLDRSVMGSFHHVSLKHLPAYIEELEWRFNNRDNPYLFRDTLMKLLKADSLPYQELTA